MYKKNMMHSRGHQEFDQYKDAIARLRFRERPEPKLLLRPRFRIERSGNLEVYYAPVDYVNRKAQIALVGITPGLHQMEVAYRVAREAILDGLGRVAACRRAKKTAAFSGAMRKNLVEMLDGIGVPKALGLESSGELFDRAHMKLHSTSVLRYPVFVDQKNYTGHNPHVLAHPVLKRYVEEVFSKEIGMVPSAFIIPLGKAVNSVLEYLIGQGRISPDQCCLGFPHPSGANGHRKAQFSTQRRRMTMRLHKWFDI